ncbi:unnamed protein product [Boreogadus saida]
MATTVRALNTSSLLLAYQAELEVFTQSRVIPYQPTGPSGPEPATGAQRCMGEETTRARGDAPSSYSLWSHEETERYLGRGGQGVLGRVTEGMFKVLQKACRSLFGLHDQTKKRKNFRVNGPLYDALSIAENDQWRRIRSVLSPCFSSGRLKEECLSSTNRLVRFPQALDLTVNQHVQCCNSTLIKTTREQEQGQEGKTKQKELIPPL